MSQKCFYVWIDPPKFIWDTPYSEIPKFVWDTFKCVARHIASFRTEPLEKNDFTKHHDFNVTEGLNAILFAIPHADVLNFNFTRVFHQGLQNIFDVEGLARNEISSFIPDNILGKIWTLERK